MSRFGLCMKSFLPLWARCARRTGYHLGKLWLGDWEIFSPSLPIVNYCNLQCIASSTIGIYVPILTSPLPRHIHLSYTAPISLSTHPSPRPPLLICTCTYSVSTSPLLPSYLTTPTPPPLKPIHYSTRPKTHPYKTRRGCVLLP